MTKTQYDGPMPLSLLEVKLRCLVFILDCLIVHQLTNERWFHRTLCKCVYIGPKINPHKNLCWRVYEACQSPFGR